MAHRIIGLDLGAHSVKAVVVDPKAGHRLVAFEEERVRVVPPGLTSPALTPAPSPAEPERGDSGASGGDRPPEGDPAWATPDADEVPVLLPAGLGAEDTSPEAAPSAQAQAPAPLAAEPSEASEIIEDDEEAESALPWLLALDRVLDRLGDVSHDTIVTYLPDGRALTSQFSVPFTERAAVERILPGLLADRLPIQLDEAVHDFRMLQGIEGPEALVAFARHQHMAEFLGALEAAGIDPTTVTVPELMLEFAAEFALGERASASTYAVLDLGHATTRVLVRHERALLLSRATGVGGEALTAALADGLGVSMDEAEQLKHRVGLLGQEGELGKVSSIVRRALRPVLRDLRRTLQAVQTQHEVEIDALYICGGTSHLPGLPELLTDTLGLPVEPLPAIHGDGEIPMAPLTEARVVLAHALAAHPALDRQNARRLNLRQGPFIFQGRSDYVRAQLARVALAVAAIVMLTGGVLLMKKRDLDARRDAMHAAVVTESKKIFGTPVTSIKKIEQRVAQESTSQGTFIPKVSAYELTYQVISKVNANTALTLDRIEVDVDRHVVQIYGTTKDPQAVDSIVSDLEQLKCLKSIQKDKLQVRKEDEATFELQIVSACES